MTFVPLRVRAISKSEALCVNDDGSFFSGSNDFVARLADEHLQAHDVAFLTANGHYLDLGKRLDRAAHQYAVAERLSYAGPLDYLILVPTLRCNLRCSYCQVSRVNVDRAGFDWSDSTLAAVFAQLAAMTSKRIKIEFQGGEPTLRPDLLLAVMNQCQRFEQREFVICTNLVELSDEILALFDRDDVFISTSLDGNHATHGRNRTESSGATEQFFRNLRMIVDRYGPRKVSALPTVDPTRPPEIDDMIDVFRDHGIDSIFLRPINFQGFARKQHASSLAQGQDWREYYVRFVRRIIERNWQDRSRVIEETYLSIALRRIFQPNRDRHVDLRNPNPMGFDYIVVDYDGTVYPTDEARMLTRSGVVDLSIGTIQTGWDSDVRATLNYHSTNQFDPDCVQCAFQPYCGRDVVDDLSRYGSIDVPRHKTEFCRRHLHLFDFAFELIYDPDPAVRYSIGRWLRLPETPAHLGERHL